MRDVRLCLAPEVIYNNTLQLLRTYSWDIVDHAFQFLSTVRTIDAHSGLFDLILLVHEHERVAEWEVLTFDLAYQASNASQFTLGLYMIQLLVVAKRSDRLLNKGNCHSLSHFSLHFSN